MLRLHPVIKITPTVDVWTGWATTGGATAYGRQLACVFASSAALMEQLDYNLLDRWFVSALRLRVFPLSNWTEPNVWFYIAREQPQIDAVFAPSAVDNQRQRARGNHPGNGGKPIFRAARTSDRSRRHSRLWSAKDRKDISRERSGRPCPICHRRVRCPTQAQGPFAPRRVRLGRSRQLREPGGAKLGGPRRGFIRHRIGGLDGRPRHHSLEPFPRARGHLLGHQIGSPACYSACKIDPLSRGIGVQK
jgi:Phosphoadenosine phosphosulfate reductase family